MKHAKALWSVLLLCLVSGCGRGGTPKTPLRFWNGFTGPDGRTMLRLVKKFNAENPDVDVVMQRMDWATYYNKLFVAGLGKRAPEVFVIHTNAMERFARARFLRGVDDIVNSPRGIATSDLSANIWQGTESEGKHYGVPLDIHPMGMFYNTRLFKEAGLVDAQGNAKPPSTGEEFLADCRKLTRHTGSADNDRWGFVFVNYTAVAYSLMCQFGGAFFTPNFDRCLLNDPRNVAALQICVDMIRRDKVAPPPENFDAWIGFRQGRAAMAFEGIYMLNDLSKQKDLAFAGAPIPRFGPDNAVWAGSHNLCLRSDLTGKSLDAAARFVKFLSNNSLDWADGGQVPARTSLRATPRFQAMPVQAAFARQVPYIRYMIRLPWVFEYQTELDTAIEKAMRGTLSAQAALDEATARVNQIIARQKEMDREVQTARGGQP